MTAREVASRAELLKELEGYAAVYYTAPWCAPCKKLSPIMDDIADQFRGTMKVLKVNIDKVDPLEPIQSVPQVHLYEGKGLRAELPTNNKKNLLDTLQSFI